MLWMHGHCDAMQKADRKQGAVIEFEQTLQSELYVIKYVHL